MDVPVGYEELHRILMEALAHSAVGKGRERHATGEPWTEQPILNFQRWSQSNGFAVGQYAKKICEATRLSPLAAKHELLGAIVYAAAAIRHVEEQANG